MPLTWEDFFGLQRFGITPNLDNIRQFCRHLGYPERDFPAVHVGGTNGKGSVVAILDAILRRAGLKVGRYTSPHLLSFGERIHVDGKPVSDEDVFSFLEDHWAFIQRNHCTFFEVATAMALDAFSRSGVDVAVVEVGLGGTYDATSVVNTILAAITRIDYDHTDRLGSTLPQIAANKAGILRSNQPVVIGDQHPEVFDVLKSRAEETRSAYYRAAGIAELSSLSVSPRGICGTARIRHSTEALQIEHFKLPLTGSFQVENLTTALACCHLLADSFKGVNEAAIAAGLSRVNWPGRLSELQQHPTLILDVGHNPGAVRAVLKSVRSIWKPARLITLFSALRDKDVAGMMSILKDGTDRGFIVPLLPPRGLTRDEIGQMAAQIGWDAEALPTVEEGLARAMDGTGEDDLILVIGSHLLAEEVLKKLKYS